MLEKERKVKMAQKVLILGDSGTGKSASLRNFKEDEVLVINSAGKPLPFKNHFECVTPKFERLTQDVLNAMDKTDKKVIVIDDAQYIMSFQYMRRIKENGWDKWNDIQGDFFNIIKACDYMPEDVIVYFLSHIQRDDEGREKIKTMGKMLDEKITIEGLFTTVLKTAVKDGQYFFLTQNSGMDTVKSPIGMFPSYAIDNDLKYVDTKIRNYYEIGEYKTDAEVEKMDQEVKAEEIQKPDSDGRKRRRKTAEAPVDTGTGTIVGATPDEQKAEEQKTEETPAEQPKKRGRKPRNKVNDETPAEAETSSEQAENSVKDDANFESLADATPAESVVADTPTEKVDAPTRKRRRRSNVEHVESTETLDLNSDDVPF